MGSMPSAAACIAGALLMTCSWAQAQSTVVLQGILDVNVRMVRNDATLYSLSNDGISGSNFTFRGQEDLGSGLKAGFWLEAGVQLDTGGGGGSNGLGSALFNRRSTVQLSSPFGEIRLGRDFTPSYGNISRFDPFKANGIANANNLEPTTASLGSAAFTLLRTNNAVSYFTPVMGGFFAHAMVAAGEGTPGQKYRGLRTGYMKSDVEVAISIGITQGDAADNDFKVVNVGGMYDFGMVRPMAFYQKGTYKTRRQDNWLVGVAVPMGAGELRLSYQRADQSGAGTDANDATQVALGYVHRLSKRTALYGNTARVSNKGMQTYRASSSGGTLTPGATSTGAEIGIQHIF